MRRMIIDIHYDYDHDNCSDNCDDDDPCNEDEKYKQTKYSKIWLQFMLIHQCMNAINRSSYMYQFRVVEIWNARLNLKEYKRKLARPNFTCVWVRVNMCCSSELLITLNSRIVGHELDKRGGPIATIRVANIFEGILLEINNFSGMYLSQGTLVQTAESTFQPRKLAGKMCKSGLFCDKSALIMTM